MSVVIVTGSAGLVGAETVRFFANKGCDVFGIDNNMRAILFGAEASTDWSRQELQRTVPRYRHSSLDIRQADGINQLFKHVGKDVLAIIHAAAQPAHDWAVRAPLIDFEINAVGTMNVLEATRKFCPDAAFIYTSTSKVYGDNPNRWEYVELQKRYDLTPNHLYWRGMTEMMSIDHCLHSLFGSSKLAADIMTQEYGRYFGMKTVCFRGACLTGPGHSGTALHGFLAYLVKCAVTHQPYTVIGYKGKQVRDNIHSRDLVEAFWQFVQWPRSGEVYNMGAGRKADCSILEAIDLVEELTHSKMDWEYTDKPRIGDHKFWISDTAKFRSHYPEWKCQYDLRMILTEIIDATKARLTVGSNPSP